MSPSTIVGRRMATSSARYFYGFGRGSHNFNTNWHKWREAQMLAGTPELQTRAATPLPLGQMFAGLATFALGFSANWWIGQRVPKSA